MTDLSKIVKPLVWYDRPEKQQKRIGRCGDIAYAVWFDMGAWGYQRQGETGLTVSMPGCAFFSNEADAMRGAEEDHARRILSAIDPDALMRAGIEEGLRMGADRLLEVVKKDYGDHRDYRKAITALSTYPEAIAAAVARVKGGE